MSDVDSSASDGAQDGAGCDAASFLSFAIEIGHDPRKGRDETERHVRVALRFLRQMRGYGISIVSTHSGLFVSDGGDWVRPSKKWLAVQLESACVSLCINSTAALIRETRAWLMRQPELWRDEMPQNAGSSTGAQP